MRPSSLLSTLLEPHLSTSPTAQGKLTSMPEQFPDAPGVYLILLSSPSDPHWQNSRGARPTWHPVFLGVTSDGESLRKRMHYYIHPKLGPGGEGAFHPKAGDYFRYKLFRKLQPRGFSVQIRWVVGRLVVISWRRLVCLKAKLCALQEEAGGAD